MGDSVNYTPKPGENAAFDFKYVMNLVKSVWEPVKDYEEGLSRLEATVNWVSREAEKLKLNFPDLQIRVKEFREKYGGDISPALNHLSQFTYDLDPRCSNTAPDYLVGVLWWASVAEEYLKRNMKVAEKITLSKTFNNNL